jgi:hypothetical protein
MVKDAVVVNEGAVENEAAVENEGAVENTELVTESVGVDGPGAAYEPVPAAA